MLDTFFWDPMTFMLAHCSWTASRSYRIQDLVTVKVTEVHYTSFHVYETNFALWHNLFWTHVVSRYTQLWRNKHNWLERRHSLHNLQHQQQQPGLLTQGRLNPCIHAANAKFWTGHLPTRPHFFNLKLSSSGEPVPTEISELCSWLTGHPEWNPEWSSAVVVPSGFKGGCVVDSEKPFCGENADHQFKTPKPIQSESQSSHFFQFDL